MSPTTIASVQQQLEGAGMVTTESLLDNNQIEQAISVQLNLSDQKLGRKDPFSLKKSFTHILLILFFCSSFAEKNSG